MSNYPRHETDNVGSLNLGILWSRFTLFLIFAITLVFSTGLLISRFNQLTVAPFDGTVWDNPGAYTSTLQAGVSHHTYRSRIIGADIGYNIVLPNAYFSDPTQRFPVIYLLHGVGGDENSSIYFSNVSQTGMRPTIYVAVNGFRNSKYRDAIPGSPMYAIEMIESSFIHELVPFIDATYRTVDGKGGRAIQGFSMGGMGALRLAFKYPQLFSSVYAFSPAIDDDASNVLADEPALMFNMFNNDVAAFVAQNVQTLANTNAEKIRGLKIHVTIGSEDNLLPYSQALMAQLDSLNIPHDPLQIVIGFGHDGIGLSNAVGSAPLQFATSAFSWSSATSAR